MKLSYACGVSTDSLLGLTLGELLEQTATRFPDSDAVIAPFQDTRWTYAELLQKTDQIARGLMDMEVEKGAQQNSVPYSARPLRSRIVSLTPPRSSRVPEARKRVALGVNPGSVVH